MSIIIRYLFELKKSVYFRKLVKIKLLVKSYLQ